MAEKRGTQPPPRKRQGCVFYARSPDLAVGAAVQPALPMPAIGYPGLARADGIGIMTPYQRGPILPMPVCRRKRGWTATPEEIP
ncbi:hypothetical protein AE1304_41250 [Aeromonas enteropelogenes]